ncbi:MAG: LamG-like jellyroll fold domain-containing protein [Verrucomicrobiota bacterium]|nr:FecR domain-containing protein [Limisphaera sp.]MDW8381981.1 LamG-like jellyroll fold domain-containing protein [Verrucomicrobiota bacterium]
MDVDLQDFLIAWSGGPLEESRLQALQERLRTDAVFRRECARQIHMLGMLKTVQAPSPRWLRLEEELREAGAVEPLAEAELRLEDRVMARLVRSVEPWRRLLRWLPPAVVTGLVLAGGLALFFWQKSPPAVPLHLREVLGVVVQAQDVVWDRASELRLRVDDMLEPGWLRLRSGRISLALFNGVRLHVEGPAAVQLRSLSYVYCEEGRLAVHVPPQSEIKDFTIASPGAAIRDMGTEFGFNVSREGPVEVLVFRGAAEASVLAPNGTTLRSEVLPEQTAARVDASRGVIEPGQLPVSRFVQPPRVDPRPLALAPDYPRAVLSRSPWAYWRFETVAEGKVPNELPDRPALRVHGQVQFPIVGDGNRAVRFEPKQARAYLESEEPWLNPGGDYALEFLFSSEQYRNSALIGLLNTEDQHLALVELTARDPEHLVHKPGTLRYVHRLPPATSGGINLFSTRVFFPYRWHHIVAQRKGSRLEMWIDGVLAAAAQADSPRMAPPCRVLLGRLRHQPVPPEDVRGLAGHLDEVAVYTQALPADVIGHHAALAGCYDVLEHASRQARR